MGNPSKVNESKTYIVSGDPRHPDAFDEASLSLSFRPFLFKVVATGASHGQWPLV